MKIDENLIVNVDLAVLINLPRVINYELWKRCAGLWTNKMTINNEAKLYYNINSNPDIKYWMSNKKIALPFKTRVVYKITDQSNKQFKPIILQYRQKPNYLYNVMNN